jgi:hypothetical protein
MSVEYFDKVIYKEFVGYVIARQLPLPVNGMVAGYLVAFPKPKKIKAITPQAWREATDKFAETFKCDPEHLGPCVNWIIPENELKLVD